MQLNKKYSLLRISKVSVIFLLSPVQLTRAESILKLSYFLLSMNWQHESLSIFLFGCL